MSDNKNIHDMTEEDIIDSVKNVDIKIRDYRADDDFEQMLAQLNSRNKPKEPAPAKSETKPAKPAESARSAKPVEPAEPAEHAEPANPVGADKPVQHKQPPKKRPAGQKPAGKKRPAGQTGQAGQSGQKKPAPSNANAKKPANGANPAKSAPTKQAKKPEKQPAKAPEKEPEQPLIPNLEEIWKNPNLADGGRVAMNIKTDLRKEIKITIPKELAEKPKQKPAPAKKPAPAPAKSGKSEKAVNALTRAQKARSRTSRERLKSPPPRRTYPPLRQSLPRSSKPLRWLSLRSRQNLRSQPDLQNLHRKKRLKKPCQQWRLPPCLWTRVSAADRLSRPSRAKSVKHPCRPRPPKPHP